MCICERWAPHLLGNNIQDKALNQSLRDMLSDFYDSIINKAKEDNDCKQFDTAKAEQEYRQKLATFAVDGIKPFVDWLKKP